MQVPTGAAYGSDLVGSGRGGSASAGSVAAPIQAGGPRHVWRPAELREPSGSAADFEWRGGRLHDLGALPGNNSSAVFEVNRGGVGVGMSETAITDPNTGWPADHAVMFKGGKVIDLGTLRGGYES